MRNIIQSDIADQNVAKCKHIPVHFRAVGGTRRGNMGHLTRIANMVVHNLEKGPVQAQITDLIKGIYLLSWIGVKGSL